MGLAQKREQAQLAESAEVWLVALRESVSEIEVDTEEAFEKRRQLVELLVAGITAGKKDGRPDVRITYRFSPPSKTDIGGEETVVDGVKNSCRLFAVTETGPKLVAPRTRTPISISGSSITTAANVSR